MRNDPFKQISEEGRWRRRKQIKIQQHKITTENGESAGVKAKPMTERHREPSQLVFLANAQRGHPCVKQGSGPHPREGVLSGMDECRPKATPLFLPSYHLSLLSPPPSVSSLHLPDARSSSSVCRHFHLFPFDMAFYLRSNSHHFNQDRIALRRLPLNLVRACVRLSGGVVCLRRNNRPDPSSIGGEHWEHLRPSEALRCWTFAWWRVHLIWPRIPDQSVAEFRGERRQKAGWKGKRLLRGDRGDFPEKSLFGWRERTSISAGSVKGVNLSSSLWPWSL